MRIIAGEFRSRALKSLPGLDVRPTPDRLREALFNVLSPRIEGSVFIDAYAGTGAVGIEALSRGAARAVFLERSREAARVIHDNLKALGLEHRADVMLGRASQLLAKHAGDIVFLDPPYRLSREYEASFETLATDPPPLTIAQHDRRTQLDDSYGPLKLSRTLRQGDNVLSFFVPEAQ